MLKKRIVFIMVLLAIILTVCTSKKEAVTASVEIAFENTGSVGSETAVVTEADFGTEQNATGVTITRYTGVAKDVAIPETIGGMAVTEIAYWAFLDKRLTNVIIPNTVTVIGDGAFGVNLLTDIIIPDSVTSINYGVFNKNQLTSIIIPASVTVIA